MKTTAIVNRNSMRLMNRFRNIFMLLILLVVSVQGAWAISGEWKDNAASNYASGKGTKEEPYVIMKADQLALLSNKVSNGENYSGVYFILGADIDLGAYYWNPIGRLNEYNYAFKGKFDGRGHIISNMTILWNDNSAVNRYGLFSAIESGAEIYNLVIDKAKMQRTSSSNLTNDIVLGVLTGATRQNTTVRNIIIRNSKITSNVELTVNNVNVIVGGLVGTLSQSNNHVFSDVAVQTDIDLSNLKGVIKNYRVGGISGEWKGNNSNPLTNAYYMGMITNPAKVSGKVGNSIIGDTNYSSSFCTNLYRVNDAPSGNDQAVKKSLDEFAALFAKKNNEYISSNNYVDLFPWYYDNTIKGYSLLYTELTSAHESTHLKNEHVYTMTANGDFTYEWYVNDVLQSSKKNVATLPTKAVEQTGRVVIKQGTEKIVERRFVIPAEIYGVEEHLHANSYASGNGTQASPYIINNDLQLAKLALDINRGVNTDKYYKITADIDLSKAIWTPIGSIVYSTNTTFKGALDGTGHTISNMKLDWYNATGSECRFGLFASIDGTSGKWSDVRNLIIENAKIKNDNASNLAGSRLVGILAGTIHQYSNIQNIIIRSSEISCPNSSFGQNSKWLILSGLAGKINENNNNYKFNNIAVNVKIDAGKLGVNYQSRVFVGGFIAEWATSAKTCVNNVYAQGKITAPSSASCDYVGTIFGKNYENVSQATLYYDVTEVNGKELKKQGTQKSLAGFAVPFCNANNDFISSNSIQGLSSWFYDNAKKVFYLDKFNTDLSIVKKKNVVVTASTFGMDGSEKYNWYISTDEKNWKKTDLSSSNVLILQYEGDTKYVYAEVADGSSRSASFAINTVIKADAHLNKVGGSYSADVEITNDNCELQYIDAIYKWLVNESTVQEGESNTYTPTDPNAKVSCQVTLKNGEYTILDKTLHTETVVFLLPEGGDDGNSGMDEQHPVRTWQKAYSLLKEDNSWDENKIVLMGRSDKNATCYSGVLRINGNDVYYGGFAVTNNLNNNVNSEDYKTWKEKVDASHLAKHVTITGKYNGKVYPAVIENYGFNGKKYLGIFGDTRFEYITFNHANNVGHSDYIFCQYHNLEMGEGIQMTNYNPGDTPSYGRIDGANIFSMQIYGGFNNDARFHKNAEVLYNKDSEPGKNNSLEAMERAMPHGKEGFSITLKSGRYSAICVGGRQSGEKMNGLMGTPNMPLKCTITVDIDRQWNDEHNQGLNGTKADYDCGTIQAACQEGAMYADVDIIVKSGYVARIVSGTLGNRIKNYQGSYNKPMPANTFVGRANILIDPRKSNGEIDNDKVIVTELYGGSTGRGYDAKTNTYTIDNPVYGYNTVKINGGTFKILPENNPEKANIFCGIFGAGAGGYNGIGDDTHHTPDKYIAYWGDDRILFGDYATAKNKLVKAKCYDADRNEFTIVDPRDTHTTIEINGGIFGSENQKIDGIYAGGSGFMSPGLFHDTYVTPSPYGGNVYGSTGKTVSSLIIKGGTFWCEHGIFAGGRGTDKFYSENAYLGDPANYTKLGQTYGDIKLEIYGGTFNCDIFGGGYGVADAKLIGSQSDEPTATLSEMARVYGNTELKITGKTVINGSVYGGGDMAAVDNGTSDATNLTIGGEVVVNGDVFASGNGRRYMKKPTDLNLYTSQPELVGLIKGNANLSISGTPQIHGNIYGGGAYASTEGNTNVTVEGGYFHKNIYGGGQGDLATETKATITGDATVTMSGAQAVLGTGETSAFAADLHNVYGGGYLDAAVKGTAIVNVTRAFTNSDITGSEAWNKAYNDVKKYHNFCVYGGGYGANTTVYNTSVNINIDVEKNNVLLGSIGGAYAGVVENNASTTIKGTPILRSVYGGGYGTDEQGANGTTGIVGKNASLNIEGGKFYCDVFAGGAGVESKTTTYKDVARVYENTSVTVTGTAAVYGSVFGGGDVANVGDNDDKNKVEYTIMPTSTSVDSDGKIIDYKHENSRTFVDITGGNIYGMVYGGGNGRLKADVKEYENVGRVKGNTLVHIANSIDVNNNAVEPYIWNRIYGAGSYGTVEGNSKVHVEGGHLGYNIFGGGFGDASTDTPNTAKANRKGTYANVLGNTNVTIDGGSWIWYAKADIDGNITTWDNINNKLSVPFETWRNKSENDRIALIRPYFKEGFYEKVADGYRFAINHNIYGGGRAACYVGQDDNDNTGKSTVIINHSPLTDVAYNGKIYNLLDPNTAAGCCWYSSIDNIRNPQFSVFGAGYGMNTKVKDTEVMAQPGVKLDANGHVVGGMAYNRYVNQMADMWKYVEFEQAIYDDYQAVDDDTRRKLYGMGENTDDPRTYLRYRASQLAWSMGSPSFTFMDIHGGSFSGYVTGNTKVVTDCQLFCRSVFGGGIGSKPEGTPTGNETYGQVYGSTDVKIYGGTISMNVFGGGAGIEPYAVGGKDIAFPEMARVKGKTNVDVYGESYKIERVDNRDIERTLIFGSVYGGGDVANVGNPDSQVSAAELKGNEKTFVTKVNVWGASIMSPVFAGGNGRYKSSHYDYTKIGAVYGNAGLFVNKADKAYPYTSDDAPSSDVIPYLWSRAYGGGNKGIIKGNTLVKIDNGYFSDDIFAGGLGDATTKTSADVLHNTNLIVNGGEAKLTSLWNPETRAWTAATMYENHLYSPQYDPEKRKFKVNHNMYGGGNLACVVNGNTYITMTKGMLDKQETVSATANPDGNFFATNEWKEVYYKTGSPYFCVFGGGYGKQAVINGNTYVNVGMLEDENSHVHIEDIPDRKEGEEYLHFIPAQSVMDIVGGGYEGQVIGETNVNVSDGTFARRVFGGGQYNSVKISNVNIDAIDCQDVFGGGMLGDVEKTVNVNIGVKSSADHKSIHIHGNVYGGNDVAGYVNLTDKQQGNEVVFQDNGGDGVNVTIKCGHIYGNVYGAGNGDYLYALDKAGNTSPTVNEYYRSEKNVYDLVFTVPMRSTIASSASNATDAQKIVNINSWRPLTNKVTVKIDGKNKTSKPEIFGNVYGGGNSATVVKTGSDGYVKLNVGSNIKLGGLFLGCDGEQLFTQSGKKDYMTAIKDIDGIDLNAAIDWNNTANKSINEIYVPADNERRPKAYPHILDLYFQPVAMSIRPEIIWLPNLANDTIGSFVCGGNRGNMDVVPDANGNAVSVTFPAGLTITDKIVGGCYNANYDANTSNNISVNHVGGYLLGASRTTKPMIDLTVNCNFAPSVVEDSGKRYYEGANVYGGCYKSGVIVGDVRIDYRSNSLQGLEEALLAVSNENDIAACNVYGAGYGENSYVYGDIDVLYSNQVPWSNNSGTTVNNVFGGGQKGNVIGNTDIRILNGKVLGSVTGGSYSGNLWGTAQVLVGYPKYYLCKKSAKYNILRADDAAANLKMDNTYYDANGKKYTTKTIKQFLYIMAGDIVSEQVYDAIKAYDDKNNTLQIANAFEEKTTEPSYPNKWNDVDIHIGVAVYGGGYSTAASGSSALTNTTVLKYTEKYNNVELNYSGSKEGNSNYANGTDPDLSVDEVKNYGGNTTMLIADDPTYSKEHITISPQEMKLASELADNADLFQKYYVDRAGNYRYISVEGKYFKKGPWPADISTTNHNFYEADTEGGIFGDGHLSYAEGFRNCELSGYGYAKHTINSGKILNTFQRLDMLRLKDNCIKLLGARDYATSSTDVTPYSISRVGEIQMVSSIDATNNALTVRKPKLENGDDDPSDPFLFGYKKRNYLGLSNNIRYVGAIITNDEFEKAMWHGKDGKLGAGDYSGKTYQEVKYDYLKYHQYAAGITGNASVEKDEVKYQKRNEGTARNLIGIASGYALRIRNVQETYSKKGKLTETAFYGPIVGVAEIRLVNVDPDEAGGYVYADDRHVSTTGSSYKNSLLKTGNFVFPYVENPDMFVVDDCFPSGWEQNKINQKKNSSHYWYLTGYHFYLNANISAFTYNSAGNPIEFESNSEIDLDDVEVLKGLAPGQEDIKIVSWTLRSDHPTSYDEFESDLERRNYDVAATDHSQYPLKDKYKLYVSVSGDKKCTNNEVWRWLPMTMNTDSLIAKGTPMEGKLSDKTDVARLAFKLVDNVDNTTSEYYNRHLKLPTKATLVLRAPAYRRDENGNYVPDNTKMAMSVFYTKNGDDYDQTATNTALSAGTKYYFRNVDTGEYEMFYDGTKFLNYVYKKKDDQYTDPLKIEDIKPTTGGAVFYVDVARSYTYTIYLNIKYIQGPAPEGNIEIANCALPGEFIKVDASTITVAADQSMRPETFYWRIGKLNAEGTAFEDNSPWTKEDAGDSSKGYETWQVKTDRTGIFARCLPVENENGHLLYIPAYYFMNGYGVQFGFATRESRDSELGEEYVFYPIDMKKVDGKIQDRLEVHNFHRMDSHNSDIKLRLDEAVERAKNEPKAQPRIYIGDDADLTAFSKFVRTNKYHGANAQFVLLKDLELPSGYIVPDEFAGTLHGDGHVITGEKLFKKNSGNIHNLGVVGGVIAESNTNTGKYHCCFERDNLKVYDIDGNAMSGYTDDDFKYGKVAYDLNQYYQKKADDNGDNAYTYVENYYSNGDYQYARVDDESASVPSGIKYLRKDVDGKGDLSLPRYEIMGETAHNMEHPADIRSKGSKCEPLFDKNGMNDYRFFGQSLQAEPEVYPSAITSHIVKAALNRVWRTNGYYGSKTADWFYYNAAIYEDNHMGTYVLNPKTTAVDFNFTDDNASEFYSFGTAEDVTRNLLVYTGWDNVRKNNEAVDVVAQTLAYDESTPEAAIRGHHVIINKNNEWKASKLHLVDKQTFNAPIAFSVTGKSWYVRNPETETGYVEKVGRAWESICLPFKVNKSTLSKGIQMYKESDGTADEFITNISFFYGTPKTGTAVAKDNNTLHHHYWFREFKSISGNEATFERPENPITNDGFDAYTSYIVSFPGSRFYEFDMTGQTITFENSSKASIDVTDDKVAEANTGKLYRVAFANEEASTSKYAIAIGETGDDQGMKFEKSQPIYAFRGYMAKSASAGAKANSFTPDDDVIYISTDIRNIESLDEDENSADVAGEYLRVYDAGNHTIGVESSYDTKLTIYTSAGQIARILDVRAGNSKYGGFASGIYVVGQKKLSVK